MEFRVLGPLEVHAGGESLALGGRKQKGVLALLLLQPNQVVSTDRLIDELWGERPPRAVEAQIQNCIFRLRGVLGRELIETRSPGYLIHVDPQNVDSLRFELAVSEARGLAPRERAAALREALEYWRGPPLDGLTFEGPARIELGRLDELRLAALELRLDAELELGRHETVLAEIDALAHRHPGRERLRYLQMLALYRSRRQRDALRAYQEARLELVELYGLEPGEDLRALERMIISHDPALELSPKPTEERFDLERRKHVVALALELVVVGGLADEAARARVGTSLAEIALIVDRHGGGVKALAPEDVTAVFGAPTAHDDDTMRALRAATEIRGTLPAGISARFAVERGVEPVSAARSLLAGGRSGDLLLGAGALRVVPRAVDVVPHGSGRCYRVIRFDPDAEPFVRHFEIPLVGRRAQLARLASELEAAVHARAPRHVAVLGEAGIGKTRLVREFVANARRTVPVLTGRCAAYGERAALLPLGDILAQAAPLEAVFAGEADADRVIAQLQDLSLTGRAEGLWALRRLLEVLARHGPVVLVLEDVHSASPAVLDLVEYLVGWTDAALLVISLARLELLELRPEWREAATFLEPLAPAELEVLAAALPGADRLELRELAAAVAAAEGNPLFLEQLLAAGGGELGSVPPTIDVLIESRLDRLPAAEREVLECAAVVGREFWRAAVEAAASEPERSAVSSSLMALVRRRLIRPETSPFKGEEGFRFHHALIRDVAYSCIGDERRARLHESVARSLEGREPEPHELIGYHLEQAALLSAAPTLAEEAGRRLGAAGLLALKRIDGDAGVDLLTRATALLAADASRLELDWALATSVKFSGDAQRADALLDDVAVKAARLGAESIELRARIEQIWERLWRSELSVEQALGLLDRARLTFEPGGDDLGLGRAWHLTAAVEGVYRLRYDHVEHAATRGAFHYRRTGFDGAALHLLAASAARGTTPADEAIDRCEALLLDAPTPFWEGFILPFLASVEAMAGRFEEARDHLEEARVRQEEFSDTTTSWSALAAEVELLAGKPERAETILLRSCELLRSAGEGEWLATNSAILADAQYRLGRIEEAQASSSVALAIAPSEHLTSQAVARRVQAKCLARLGRADDAVELAVEALRLLGDADVLDERAETLVACAEALSLSGAVAEAEQRFREALAAFEQKGNEVSAARVRAQLSSAG